MQPFHTLRPSPEVRPDSRPPIEGGEEIIAWCKGKIANYKIPHEVIFIAAEEWPMSATKVDKRQLRARLTAVSTG